MPMPDATNVVPARRMSVSRGTLHGAGVASMDAVAAARVAAIVAAKQAWLTLPDAVPFQLTDASCDIEASGASTIVTMTVQAYARTTLDAAALCGASAALLSLWESARGLASDLPGARIELAVIQNVQD